MKKVFTLIGFAGLIVASNTADAQNCVLTLSANPMQVCVGDSSVVSAAVQVPGVNNTFDFNNSQLPPGWTFTGGQTWSAPCAGPSLDNSPFYWSSTSASNVLPGVTTVALDVTAGGDLIFDFRFFPNSSNAPCETADQYNEGVLMEYSTDNGVTWNNIVYFCPVPAGGPWNFYGGYAQTLPGIPASAAPGNLNGSCGIFDNWATYTIPIPPAAQTTSTMFRWRQQNSSNQCCDNWGLDNITVAATPSMYFQWSNGVNGYSENNLTFSNLQNDTTIIVTVTDTATNLTCTDTIVILVDPLPTLDLVYPNPICATQSVLFQGSGSSVPGADFEFDLDNNGSYEYNVAGGDTTFNYFVIAGNYNIGFRVTAPGGCSAEGDFPVQVYANPGINLSANPLEICTGTPINLLAAGSIINPPSLPSTLTQYQWDFENDGTIDTTNGAGPNAGQTYIYNTPGTYYAWVSVSTSGNCSNADSVEIVVNSLPVAGFTVANECSGDLASLIDTTQIVAPDFVNNWSWDLENVSTGFTTNASGGMPVFLLNDTGTYDVTLIVISDKGCTDTAEGSFKIYPNPVANFSYQTNCFRKNDFSDISEIFTTQHSNQWSLDGDSSTIELTDQYVFTHTFEDSSDQNVTLFVSDGNGCTDDTTMLVNVKGGIGDPIMPNVLKHSSAFGNDKFDFTTFAPGFNDCIDYTFSIYNRWGAKVYETNNNIENPDLNCTNCFTGKSNTGSELAPGTYYFVLSGVGDEGATKITKNGMVTILD